MRWFRPQALGAPSPLRGDPRGGGLAGAMASRATVVVVDRVVMALAATCRRQLSLAVPVARSRAAMVARVLPVATTRQGVIASEAVQHSPIQ